MEPCKLNDCIIYTSILSLNARTGDKILSLGRPRNKVVTKKSVEPKERVPRRHQRTHMEPMRKRNHIDTEECV